MNIKLSCVLYVSAHDYTIVTTLSVAFPCLEYCSMEAVAAHALALRHQHLWCLTTVVLVCSLVLVCKCTINPFPALIKSILFH